MIDLHSHLLPNIDDGARSAEQSTDVLRVLAAHGVEQLVLTPHARATEIATDPDDPLERREAAHETLGRHDLNATPTLHLGFEIMLDASLPAIVFRDRRYTLAGSQYVLVEFPLMIVADYARRMLAEITRGGLVPLVAHPERYQACTPAAVAAWRAAGARTQVDATTLTRPTTRGHRARQLLAAGLADVIAADNHGDARSVRTGAEYLTKRGGAMQVQLLTRHNPTAVIDDADMQPVPPLRLKERWRDRLRRFGQGR